MHKHLSADFSDRALLVAGLGVRLWNARDLLLPYSPLVMCKATVKPTGLWPSQTRGPAPHSEEKQKLTGLR